MSQPTPPVQPGASLRVPAVPDDPTELYRRLHDAETSNRLRGDILQQVSDAVLLVDHDQRVVFLNAAAERRYGRAAADAVGQPLTELYTDRWLLLSDLLTHLSTA
jgi:PAS domain-containing protein